MWPFISIFAICITIVYCILLLTYYSWFKKLAMFTPAANTTAVNRFSIIIPARNEAANIGVCLNSILQNQYPTALFEIIVVDDFSTDNTAEIVQQLMQLHQNIQLIQLKNIVDYPINSYKKKSIETAIGYSKHDWIITTDADCIVSPQWLGLFDAYIQKSNAVFIAAPVQFIQERSFISVFQSLDFISLQGITAASVSAGFHSMCNGANLAYTKAAFYAVNGFVGVDTIASGDDMLLMHKIQLAYPNGIGYLFNQKAIVATQPMPNWTSFINQRIRWASKATSYTDKKIFLVLLLVYLVNLMLLLLPLLAIWHQSFLPFFGYLLLAKTACELFFLLPVARFFNAQSLLRWFPAMQPFHIVYTVLSGWLGKFGKYEWKGRQVQ
jgi:cellulose synthase/poly-beta-1,6-N-acetylglucosamine synthase-like glycosyltransferase